MNGKVLETDKGWTQSTGVSGRGNIQNRKKVWQVSIISISRAKTFGNRPLKDEMVKKSLHLMWSLIISKTISTNIKTIFYLLSLIIPIVIPNIKLVTTDEFPVRNLICICSISELSQVAWNNFYHLDAWSLLLKHFNTADWQLDTLLSYQ